MADSTLARMFWSRLERDGDLPAQMVKRGGRWQTLSWSEVGTVVREAALGLLACGQQRGDAVALLSASRAELCRPTWRFSRPAASRSRSTRRTRPS